MRPLQLLLLMLCAAPAGPVRAHDSWFQPVVAAHATGRAPQQLLLGTGQHYPQMETAVAPEYLARQGCRVAPARAREYTAARPLQPRGYAGSHALRLQMPAGAHTCWAQLLPLDVELAPELVDKYLHDIRAPAATWEAWQTQRQQGLPWRERYVKHARIDLAASPQGAATVPLDMDLVLRPARRLQVLRDGVPLADQAVELLGERMPVGLWRRSAADGLLDLGSLPPGRWLARAVDLRPQPGAPGHWASRFVTLAFVVDKDGGRETPR